MFGEMLVYGVMLAVPGAVSLFFVISIIKFCITDKTDTARRRKWLVLLIVSSLLQVLLVGSIIALIVMLSSAMAHM